MHRRLSLFANAEWDSGPEHGCCLDWKTAPFFCRIAQLTPAIFPFFLCVRWYNYHSSGGFGWVNSSLTTTLSRPACGDATLYTRECIAARIDRGKLKRLDEWTMNESDIFIRHCTFVSRTQTHTHTQLSRRVCILVGGNVTASVMGERFG